MVLETMWFREACLGFFPPFPHYFIFFSSLLGIFSILEEFWIFWRKMPFGGILGLLEAFEWDFQGF